MRSIERLRLVAGLLVCAVLLGVLLIPHRRAQAEVDAWTTTGPADSIGAVAVAPSNNQIIYAIGLQGLWKSLDGGNNWSIVGSAKLNPGAPLAVDPRNAATAYSGGSEFRAGIAKSVDGGMSWIVVRPGVNASALAIDPTRPNVLYAGLSTGGTAEILKTSNGGTDWTPAYGPINASPGIASVAGIVIDPTNADIVYAGLQLYHSGAVLRSTDAGSHWTTFSGGPDVLVPTSLAVARGSGLIGAVYVAWSIKALRRSDDGGNTWQDLTSSLPSGGRSIASLIAPGNATTIVASITGTSDKTREPGGVYVSLDGGESWDQPAPSPDNVGKLAWAPTTRVLYVGTSNGVWQYTVPETGFKKTVNPRFREYYDAHDGWRILGSPISIRAVVGPYLSQYFEKGRIEDHTGESADPNWQFMYGLLVDELQQAGANLPVGGETSTVTYATIRSEAVESLRMATPPDFSGGTVMLSDGSVFVPFTTDLSPASGHHVPGLFWDYINRDDLFPAGWMHDIGLPITEPMDAVVDKGDEVGRAITIQSFQRTVLTYDPLNPPEWQVERANVGTDYQKAFPGKVPN